MVDNIGVVQFGQNFSFATSEMDTPGKIYSPMAAGNGAYIVHSRLAERMVDYRLNPVPINRTLFPRLLNSYREEADIVHTVPEYGDVFATSDTKLAITFHNFFWDPAYRQHCSLSQKLFYRYLQSRSVTAAIERAAAITAVSQFTSELVRQAYPKVRVKTLLNGVNTTVFCPGNADRDDSSINILFSGNPTKRKGVYALKEIASGLPKDACLIVTGGLRKQRDELNHPQIKQVGNLPYEKMPALYQSVDLLLLPSYREGLSLSVLEAMACGLPVIGFDTSSMSELIIDGEGGLLCEPDNIKTLSDTINTLSQDSSALEQMGRFNRERCARLFNEDLMIGGYEKLFFSLM